MKLNLSSSIFLLLFCGIGFTQCDSLPGSTELPDSSTQLGNLTINPSIVSFSNANGVKDTTVSVTVSVSSTTNEISNQSLLLSFYDKSDPFIVLSDTLKLTDAQLNTYSTTFSFDTNTGFSGDTEVIITGVTNAGNSTNTLRRAVPIQGFSIDPAVLVRVIHQDTVQIPSAGSVTFFLSAEVTHPDKSSFINRVLVDIKDKNNAEIGTFRLYDDGSVTTIDGGGTSGDPIANDSLFTRAFTLNASNQADELTLTFYAIDVSNQESNRITSKLVFKK